MTARAAGREAGGGPLEETTMSDIKFANPVESCALTIHVSDLVFRVLVAQARAGGYTPSLYAKLLFEAGYAARCGKGAGDPILEACVARSLARRPGAPPAARPVETRVVREAVAVPVPVLIPVPIAVPIAVPAPAEPLAVHVSTGHPIEREAAEHLGTLIGAALAKFGEPPAPVPGERPQGWTASQWTLARLVCRDEGATIAEVSEALAPAYQSPRSLVTLVSTTRRNLRAVGIEIESHGDGWRVSEPSRSAADALMGRGA